MTKNSPRTQCLATSSPRGILLAVSLISSLGIAAPVLAQHVDQDAVIKFDIERKRILQPLPFDVRFSLLTPVPSEWEKVREVRAALRAKGKEGDACAVQPEITSTQSACDQVPTPGTACSLTTTLVKERATDSGTKVKQIEIFVPALEVKKDYCLGISLVREPTQDEVQLIQVAIRNAIRKNVRVLEASNKPITQDALTSVCQEVEQAVEKALEPQDLKAVRAEGVNPNDCDARKDIFSELAVSTAEHNFRTPLERAITTLEEISPTILADEPDPLLSRIRGLGSENERVVFLLGTSLPEGEAILSPAWAVAAQTRVAELRRGRSAEGIDCSGLDLNARERVACFADDELFELEGDLQSLAGELQTQGLLVEARLEELVAKVSERYDDVRATTFEGFEGRFKWYWSMDEGFAHAWDAGETFSYTGMNIYTKPVNKKAPLRGLDFRRRFAFTIGLSNSKVNIPGIEPHFLDRFLLLGAGLRLTDHVRLSGGVLLFDETEPDPLVSIKRDEAYSPYASLSIDLDLVSLFQNQFGF